MTNYSLHNIGNLYIFMSQEEEEREPTPLLVVFDIDETLIQFINGNKSQNPNSQANVNKRYSTIIENAQENHFELIEGGSGESPSSMILRPHIEELFNYLKTGKENGTIAVGIWTYSDKGYAEGVARALTRKLDLGDNFFEFIYSDRDIDEDRGIPKDLSLIWNGGDTIYRPEEEPEETIHHEAFPRFNKFNTILVDDRDRNLYHQTNRGNSVLIQPFAPYGLNKVREFKENDMLLTDAIRDNIFEQLQHVCEKVVSYIEGCSTEEIETAFNTEPVFTQTKVGPSKMDLKDEFKKYEYQEGKKRGSSKEQIQLLSLGDHIHFTDVSRFDKAPSSEPEKKVEGPSPKKSSQSQSSSQMNISDTQQSQNVGGGKRRRTKKLRITRRKKSRKGRRKTRVARKYTRKYT